VIRHTNLTHDILEALAEVWTLAFLHDPLLCWIVPLTTESRTSALRRLYLTSLAMTDYATSQLHSTSDLLAVARWSNPTAPRSKPLRSQSTNITDVRTAINDALRAAARPTEPHWYLEGLGTHPEATRSGRATALVDYQLNHIDRNHYPAYLETVTSANESFYSHFGFTTVETIQFPDDGPLLYCMWRPAT
jgi:hypothetical protein